MTLSQRLYLDMKVMFDVVSGAEAIKEAAQLARAAIPYEKPTF